MSISFDIVLNIVIHRKIVVCISDLECIECCFVLRFCVGFDTKGIPAGCNRGVPAKSPPTSLRDGGSCNIPNESRALAAFRYFGAGFAEALLKSAVFWRKGMVGRW